MRSLRTDSSGGAVAERSKALLLREKINEKTKYPGFTPWPGSISMMVIGSRVTSLLSLVQPLHKLHNVKFYFALQVLTMASAFVESAPATQNGTFLVSWLVLRLKTRPV